MAKSVYVCDQDADVAIKTMMAAVVGTAVVPAHVNWALTASAMGAGAVAIGKCYGVQLTKDEGWKFVKQFVLSGRHVVSLYECRFEDTVNAYGVNWIWLCRWCSP